MPAVGSLAITWAIGRSVAMVEFGRYSSGSAERRGSPRGDGAALLIGCA